MAYLKGKHVYIDIYFETQYCLNDSNSMSTFTFLATQLNYMHQKSVKSLSNSGVEPIIQQQGSREQPNMWHHCKLKKY